MKNNLILTFFILLILTGCVGTGSKGVFGTGVSIALDPRSLGTQIDDSIMQKNLMARLTLSDKKYIIDISTKVIDNLVTGKMDNLVNCLEKENFSFLNHDLERFGEIKDGFCDVDVLFHFAADPEVRTGYDNPEDSFEQNIVNTFKLLQKIYTIYL